jgi:hypothetical protein
MGAARDAQESLPADAVVKETEVRTSSAHSTVFAPPHKFSRVPTYAVGVGRERRYSPRAMLSLPLRLIEVAAVAEVLPISLVTQNISATGVYFLSPRRIDPGTSIAFEVGLLERPLGHGSVRMSTAAHVVRVDATGTPGWHGVAASFDDIEFRRDETLPIHIVR